MLYTFLFHKVVHKKPKLIPKSTLSLDCRTESLIQKLNEVKVEDKCQKEEIE